MRSEVGGLALVDDGREPPEQGEDREAEDEVDDPHGWCSGA
jgi:hypothetical protein